MCCGYAVPQNKCVKLPFSACVCVCVCAGVLTFRIDNACRTWQSCTFGNAKMPYETDSMSFFLQRNSVWGGSYNLHVKWLSVRYSLAAVGFWLKPYGCKRWKSINFRINLIFIVTYEKENIVKLNWWKVRESYNSQKNGCDWLWWLAHFFDNVLFLLAKCIWKFRSKYFDVRYCQNLPRTLNALPQSLNQNWTYSL